MLLALFLRVHQHEAGALAVQVEDGLAGNVRRFQHLRGGEIVHRWMIPHQGADPHHERVKVRREHAIDVAMLHQLSDRDVCPIDLCAIDIAGNQVASLRQAKLLHALWVTFRLLRTLVCLRPTVFVIFDDVYETGGRRDVRLRGASGSNEERAFLIAFLGLSNCSTTSSMERCKRCIGIASSSYE